jgi:hypothetical protein
VRYDLLLVNQFVHRVVFTLCFSVLLLLPDNGSISEPNLVARNTFTSGLLFVCDRQLNKNIFVILVVVIIIIIIIIILFSKTAEV